MSDLTYRQLFIRKSNGNCYKISIPSTATITYGNLHPGSKVGYPNTISGNDDKYVLRVYEGVGSNKRQTAVFRGVDEFRDLSYELMEMEDPEMLFANNSSKFQNIAISDHTILISEPVFETADFFAEAEGQMPEEVEF